ncbi:maleylpyruvate isomerase N-terminal domain-containing protein [Nonomuraea sp. NPDC047897]|uniref:maleylpyruvate isomerase N-terminal domain-containing protein n=1 Tax=Nonomuraea sp. NPDC047897 TaxID=3364346 RepID=UPI0037174C0A
MTGTKDATVTKVPAALWREWLWRGTTLFDRLLAPLDAEDLRAPSLLPGWSRAHVAAHVGYNAQALERLLTWARTGVEQRMYPDSAARDREIAAGARLDAAALRDLVATSGARLADAIRTMPPGHWQDVEVITARGRTVPAVEVLWLRVREVWVHAVDLDRGMPFDSFPAPLLDALMTDLLDGRRRSGRQPALVLQPLDRARTWQVPIDGQRPVTLSGSTAALFAALSGRSSRDITHDGGPELDLGRWL